MRAIGAAPGSSWPSVCVSKSRSRFFKPKYKRRRLLPRLLPPCSRLFDYFGVDLTRQKMCFQQPPKTDFCWVTLYAHVAKNT